MLRFLKDIFSGKDGSFDLFHSIIAAQAATLIVLAFYNPKTMTEFATACVMLDPVAAATFPIRDDMVRLLKPNAGALAPVPQSNTPAQPG